MAKGNECKEAELVAGFPLGWGAPMVTNLPLQGDVVIYSRDGQAWQWHYKQQMADSPYPSPVLFLGHAWNCSIARTYIEQGLGRWLEMEDIPPQ